MKSRMLVLLCALPLMAADPPGFVVWSAAGIKAMDKKLSSSLNEQKFSSKQLERFGNHFAMIAHREGDGSSELHEKDADIFFVESGTARLVVGGEMVNPKTTAANEIRGTGIKNGVDRMIGPGDIVHIAAKTPHQLFPTKGHGFTYFVFKVTE